MIQTRIFGSKKDTKFWLDKPIQKGHPDYKEENIIDFATFCEEKNCSEFIRWDCGFGVCESCKIVGQSARITEYPPECLHLNDIKDFEKKLIMRKLEEKVGGKITHISHKQNWEK